MVGTSLAARQHQVANQAHRSGGKGAQHRGQRVASVGEGLFDAVDDQYPSRADRGPANASRSAPRRGRASGALNERGSTGKADGPARWRRRAAVGSDQPPRPTTPTPGATGQPAFGPVGHGLNHLGARN